MEDYYIEKLLECSKRLPVIKQFLLLLLDYDELVRYCFRLFDGKWNTGRLYEFVCQRNIVVPWSVLVTDQYKWNYFIRTIRSIGYMFRDGLSVEDLNAFEYIINTEYKYDGKEWYCRFTEKEVHYIRRVLAWVGITIRPDNKYKYYDNRILGRNTLEIFKYKEKVNCLKVCYELALQLA